MQLCKVILHKSKTCCLSKLPWVIPAPSQIMFLLLTTCDLMTPLFSFSFFLEKNMFEFFLNILRQKSGRYVCVQLLQTLNILFENISHETSLCKDTLPNCWGWSDLDLVGFPFIQWNLVLVLLHSTIWINKF